tara:strand:- start:1930 stop:5427 length:3498 start_codon:yes stop_codon:yes gene_type:complete
MNKVNGNINGTEAVARSIHNKSSPTKSSKEKRKLSEEESKTISHEVMNNKDIKKLLQIMEEFKKGNIESNKENINNFAKKMREMSEMVPGSEKLMKIVEVITVLHEKIFSYASRFRLYSLEFLNLYSILAEIRDKGNEPLSELEQMIVKSTQIRLAETNETLKLSWRCLVWVTKHYGSKHDKELIEDIKSEENSTLNLLTGRVEELPDGMLGGMDPAPKTEDVFSAVSSTDRLFSAAEIIAAANAYNKFNDGDVRVKLSDAMSIATNPDANPNQLAEAQMGLTVALQQQGTIPDPTEFSGMAVVDKGALPLQQIIQSAEHRIGTRFRVHKPSDVLRINLSGLKPDMKQEVVTQWEVAMTKVLNLDGMNAASKRASEAVTDYCEKTLTEGFETIMRDRLEEVYEKFGIDKTEEQNIMNKLDDDFTDIVEKYKIIIDDLFIEADVSTPGHYEGTAYFSMSDFSVPYKSFTSDDKDEQDKKMKKITDKLEGMITYIDTEITRVAGETETSELNDHLNKLDEIKDRIETLQQRHGKYEIPVAGNLAMFQRTSDPSYIMYQKLATLLKKANENKIYVKDIKQVLDTKKSEVKVPRNLNPFNQQQHLLSDSSQGALEPLSEAKVRNEGAAKAQTDTYRQKICELPHQISVLTSTQKDDYVTYSVSTFWDQSRGDTVSGIPVDVVRGAQLDIDIDYTITQMNILLDQITNLEAKLTSLTDKDKGDIRNILSFIGIQGVPDDKQNLQNAQKEIEKRIRRQREVVIFHDAISTTDPVELKTLTVFADAVNEPEAASIIEIQRENQDKLDSRRIQYDAIPKAIIDLGPKDAMDRLKEIIQTDEKVFKNDKAREAWANAAGGYLAGCIAFSGKAVLGIQDRLISSVDSLITHTPTFAYLAVAFIFMITIFCFILFLYAMKTGVSIRPSLLPPWFFLDTATAAKKTKTPAAAPAAPAAQQRTWFQYLTRQPPAQTPSPPSPVIQTPAEQKPLEIKILEKANKDNKKNVHADYIRYVNIVNLIIAYHSSQTTSQTTPTVKSTRLSSNIEATVSALNNILKDEALSKNLKLLMSIQSGTQSQKLPRGRENIVNKIQEVIQDIYEKKYPKLYEYITDNNEVNEAGMKFIEDNTTEPEGTRKRGGKITKRKKHLKNKTRRKKRVTKNLKKRKGLKKTGKKK